MADAKDTPLFANRAVAERMRVLSCQLAMLNDAADGLASLLEDRADERDETGDDAGRRRALVRLARAVAADVSNIHNDLDSLEGGCFAYARAPNSIESARAITAVLESLGGAPANEGAQA